MKMSANPVDNRRVLLTEWFWPQCRERQCELRKALEENIKCSAITEIVLFCETFDGLGFNSHEKVRLINVERKRPSFRELFVFANHEYEGWVVIIANNDISFKRAAFDIKMSRNDVFCISRYESLGVEEIWFDDYRDGIYRYPSHVFSQDAWMFISPKELCGGHFKMGEPGCDGRLAWLLSMSNYTLSNPGKKMKILHYHQSLERPYHGRLKLPTPYAHVGEKASKKPAIIFHLTGQNPKTQFTLFKFWRWDLFRSALSSRYEFFFTVKFLMSKL